MDEIVINTKIDTSGVQKGIEEVKAMLGQLSASTIKIGVDLQKTVNTAGTDLEGLFDNLGNRMETFLTDFSEGFVEGLTESMNDAGEAVSETNDELDEMAKRLDTNVQAIANTTANIEEYLHASKAVEKRGSRLGAIFGAIGSKLKGLGAKFTAPIKQAGSFIKKFLSIAGVIAIFKKLTSTIQGSMASLEGWGTKTSYLISDYKKSMKFVQDSMGAMFTPLLNAVLPQLITLLDRVAEGFNTIGMYISALMGQKTYTKAVKGVNDYKDAISKTGKAADQAAGSLAAFDELTVIQTPTEQQQNPFEESAIPEEIQQIKSLKDLIESIDFGAMGDKVANFVNNMVSKIKEKIENFPIEEIVAGLTTFVSRFLDGTDFTNIGATFGTLVNKIVTGIRTIFDTDPDILKKMVDAVFNFVKGFLTNTDFTNLGSTAMLVIRKIIEALVHAIKTFPAAEFAQAFSDFLWGAMSELGDFFEDFSFIDLSDSITDKLIEFVENIKWHRVLGALAKLVGTIVTSIPELLITGIETPIRLIKTLLVDFMNWIGQKLIDTGIPKLVSAGERLQNTAKDIDDAYDKYIGGAKEKVQNALDSWQTNFNDTVDSMVDAGDKAWEEAHKLAEQHEMVTQEMAMEMARQQEEARKSTESNNKATEQSYQKTATSAENSSARITAANEQTAKKTQESSDKIVSANHGAGASFDTLSSDVTSQTSTMSGKATTNIDSMRSALSNNIQLMSSLMGNKMSTMSSDVSSKTSDMASKTTTNTASMYKSLFDNMSSMAKILQEKMDTMKTQMAVNYMKMNQVTTSATTQMFNTIANMNWYSIGWNVVQGVINGIIGNLPGLLATAANMAVQTVNTVKNRLKIKSPSRVFEDEVGAMIDQGLAIGIEDEANVPLQAMSDIATSLANTAMNGIQSPMIASGSVLPTQIASGLARADYTGANQPTTSVDDLLSMLRQMRDQQQDLLETLIQVVEEKDINLVANANTGRWINKAMKAYQGVTG